MDQSDKKTEDVKKAIVRAIVFFDLLDHPLTLQEIWRNFLFLSGNDENVVIIGEVLKIMEADLIGRIIEQKNGFYFLTGRSDLVALRMRNQMLAVKKYEIALKTARYFKFVPGLKLAAVCNSLAMGNVQEESDIDFFIIADKGRIWTVRLFTNLINMIRAMRPKPDNKNNKVCLSFYVSQEDLDLEKITLPFDPYLYYWLALLDPILDDDCFNMFVSGNAWLKKYLPNFSGKIPHLSRRIGNSFRLKLLHNLNDLWLDSFAGDWLEKFARSIQMKKMSKNKIRLAEENGSSVIISDVILKFHETDRRQGFLIKWQEKIKKINHE